MDTLPQQFGLAMSGKDVPSGRKVLSSVTPWLLSLLVHCCLFGVMVFFVMVAQSGPDSVRAVIPDAYLAPRPAAPLTATPMHLDAGPAGPILADRPATMAGDAGLHIEPAPTQADTGLVGLGIDGGDPAMAELGLAAAGGGRPSSWFFGTGANARQIVYVVDRSGSMIDVFDNVRYQMLVSIGGLKPDQDFHVIMFAQNEAMENTPRRLIAATKQNKLAAARFLKEVMPEGSTTALPALQRAFEVLRGDAPKPGKLIYLLTDGAFEGPGVISSKYKTADGRVLDGNAAVLAWLRDHNRDGRIHINTFLYGYSSPDAGDVMRQIAAENGGQFRFIRLDE